MGQFGWPGMDFPDVVTFMWKLKGFQADGVACSKALREKGLVRVPRVKEGCSTGLNQPGLPNRLRA